MPDDERYAVQDPWPVWPDGFAASVQDVRALLVLCALRGPTPRKLIELAARCGTAASTLARFREGMVGSENDQAFARTLDPEAILRATQACGARFVPWDAPEYPAQLRSIHDPPAALFVVGAPPPDLTRAVAVVGACDPPTSVGSSPARWAGRSGSPA